MDEYITPEPKREGFDPRRLMRDDELRLTPDATFFGGEQANVNTAYHVRHFDSPGGDIALQAFFHMEGGNPIGGALKLSAPARLKGAITHVIRDGKQIFPVPEPKREFNARDLRVGDRIITADASRNVLFVNEDGFLLNGIHRDHDLWCPFALEGARATITHVIRDGKQIFPSPEPAWTPKVGEIILHEGMPWRVVEGCSEQTIILESLMGNLRVTRFVSDTKPYVPPVDEVAKIIAADEIYHSVQTNKRLAKAIADRYYLIEKGAK